MGGAEVAGAGADRIEVLQIGQAVADAGAAGRSGDAAPGLLSPAVVSGQEVDRCVPRAIATVTAYPIPEVAPVNEDGPPVEAGVVMLNRADDPSAGSDLGSNGDRHGLLPDLAEECATVQAGGGRVVRTQVAIGCASPPPSVWA